MGKTEKVKLFEEKVIKYGGARHYLIKMEGEDILNIIDMITQHSTFIKKK